MVQVRLVRLDRMVLLVHQESMDYKVHPDRMGKMVEMAAQDKLDKMEQQVLLAQRVCQVLWDLLDPRVKTVIQDQWDRPGSRVRRDQLKA